MIGSASPSSRGNLASDGANAFTYDIENRLVSASGAHHARLDYDPLGRLWQVTDTQSGAVTRFLYDGDALVAEYDGAGAMTHRYAHWAGADTPMAAFDGAGLSAIHHLFADHEGSIVALADGAGSLTQVNAYDEYGIPSALNQGRFQYTGQAWLAELGLYYYKARIYSPTLGRFLQTDPVGYAGGINLYDYVGNDPIDLTDPTGDDPYDAWGRAAWDFVEPLTHIPGDIIDLGRHAARGDRPLEWYTGGLPPTLSGGVISEATDGTSAALSLTRAANAERAAITEVRISHSALPEAAAHIERAQAAGQPRILTVDRTGAAARRREALRDLARRSGVDRDEYPPAMSREGGRGSSTDYTARDNRGSGSSFGHQCRHVQNGERISVTICD